MSEENPFEIKDDIEFTGNRTNQLLLSSLFDQIIKLPGGGDKRKSVAIPLTVCDKRHNAQNLFQQVNKMVTESKDPNIAAMSFASRGVYSIDGKKTYLGSRIWRIK